MRGVYLILDPEQTAGRPASLVAEATLRGGVQAIQWRQKTSSLASRWPEMLRVRQLCLTHEVPLIVNDRVDVALAVAANGVHVGQDDLPAAAARRLLPNGILGVSVTATSQVLPAVEAGADYLGVGPIFATASKPDAVSPLGLKWMGEVKKITDLPLVAIGGITVSNARAVIESGADAVAILSGICSATDMEAATRALVDQIEVKAVT